MEHFEIYKPLSNSTVSKFVTRKWIEVNDLSSDQHSVSKNIWFNTLMLRADLCDYGDACIVVKRTIDLGVDVNNDMTQKSVLFEKNASFTSCISKINNTFIDNAKDLVIMMPIYFLLEYSDNFSIKSGSFWNYY